mmetsp:Transcript_18891/g.38479  ORF Transcript_18891/g.38479 Transcript_18891/m.38479 type:complete len:80 (+) Transcript_18891:1180-1419(+)
MLWSLLPSSSESSDSRNPFPPPPRDITILNTQIETQWPCKRSGIGPQDEGANRQDENQEPEKHFTDSRAISESAGWKYG